MLLAVTIVSVLVAIAMSAVAWQATRDARRRSAARVAALADAIHGSADVRSDGATALFAGTTSEPGAGSRRGIALAAGGLVVATIAAAAVVFGGDQTRHSPPITAAVRPAGPVEPVELIALSHERDGDRLIVRGIVRNPPSAPERDRLVAVVSVFEADGTFVSSGQGRVESPALIPGGESPFSVTILTGSDIGRYRVSFQSDGGVVVHVDKRSRS